MRKILLTSSGFETRRILEIFCGLFDKDLAEIKALFIPAAANNPDAVAVLPKCMNDLLKAGILSENIDVFDLHRNMEIGELSNYDVVYFTGGSSKYLLERINETGFNRTLDGYIGSGGVYVGVSAGSIVAANNLPDGLKYINCTLSVHTSSGTKSGIIDTADNPHIDLTDGNVILILDGVCEVME
jgi:peptidase E